MTDPDLDELERLLAEATPGPWFDLIGEIHADHDGGTSVVHATSCDAYLPAFPQDTALIVALRNAAPALLRRVREAEARVRQLESDGDRLADDLGRALAAVKREADKNTDLKSQLLEKVATQDDHRGWLQANIGAAKSMLATLHPQRVLERMGFEAQVAEWEAELASLEDK